MKTLRKRALQGEVLVGTWLITGSAVCAEITGQAGFDWAVCDLEHGMGDLESLLGQLHALEATPCMPVTRVAWNEPWQVKRVLDLGSGGVMIPYVSTGEEATRAARAMRYPPDGIRGLTPLSRPAQYGLRWKDYYAEANAQVLTVVQIETADAIRNADEIAAVEGVDVLFIGPMDLSLGLGVLGQFDHPVFREACGRVVAACRNHGKAAGILLLNPAQIGPAIEQGFTFNAISSDGGELAGAMARLSGAFAPFRKGSENR